MNFLGLYLKKDHRKKSRVENRKYLKKTGHREFGVSGNVIYKKALRTLYKFGKV